MGSEMCIRDSVRTAAVVANIGSNKILLNTTDSEVDVLRTNYFHGGHTNSQVLNLNRASVNANTDASEVRFYSTNLGPQQTGDVFGFHSGLNADSSSAGSVFNVYTAGTASNYLRAGISGGGTDHNSSTWSININGTASGITVTRAAVVTDEQAGTVETLLAVSYTHLTLPTILLV